MQHSGYRTIVARSYRVRSPASTIALACAVGCGPTPNAQCVEPEWTLAIGDQDIGPPCDVAVAPDGTIVVLTDGLNPSLLEFEPDGSSWRRTELPLPAGADRGATWGNLAIAADGERWATVMYTVGYATRGFAIVRVPVTGQPTATPVQQPEVGELLLTSMAFDGDVLRAAGWLRQGEVGDPQTQSSAFIGVVDEAVPSVVPQHEYPDFRGVRLVPMSPGPLYAVVSSPSIDWSTIYIVGLDARSGALVWQRQLSPSSLVEHVNAAFPLGESDLLVGQRGRLTTTAIERYDFNGTLIWQHEHDWGPGLAGQVVAATESEVIALVDTVEEDDEIVTHVEVLDLQGTPRCSETSPLPWGNHRRATAMGSADAIVVVGDVESDPDLALIVTVLTPRWSRRP